MSAVGDVVRALVSFVVPLHFETKSGGTTKRWELRRGQVREIGSSTTERRSQGSSAGVEQ